MTSRHIRYFYNGKFLLTCLLRGMTHLTRMMSLSNTVSTHMPLARHDGDQSDTSDPIPVSTHMPLARHDFSQLLSTYIHSVSTHMPLARHDVWGLHIFVCKKWFLLTCLLRGMTGGTCYTVFSVCVSTHMPLARHDALSGYLYTHPAAFLLTCLLRGMTEI